jgi:hypothetical protein
MKELDVGDRVYLVSKEYGIDKSNPVVESDFGCVGSVLSINGHFGLNIIVKWDNGSSNDYKSIDLVKQEEYQKYYGIGDRVKLLRVEDIRPSKVNPTIGTKYECEGQITSIDSPKSLIINVEWDNGTSNIYLREHLIRVKTKLDEQINNINSIW